MRRREYLRTAAGTAGLAGLTVSALPVAGRGSPSSDHQSNSDGRTATPTPTGSEMSTDSSGGNFGPMARVRVTNDVEIPRNATEAVVTPDGRHAFVAKMDGFHAIDVSDPENPEVVATREDFFADEGGPLANLQDLKYNRGRLLVVNNAQAPVPEALLYDVTDPANPERVLAYDANHGIHNCDLHGDYAYLTAFDSLEIVDVSTTEPERVATWAVTDYDDAYVGVQRILRNVHDVYVQGGRAYLAYWDVGTWIIDVSDPTNPSHVGHAVEYTAEELSGLSRSEISEYFVEPRGNSHYVQPSDDGSLMAVGGESWDYEAEGSEPDEPESEDIGGPTGIDLWDISDPASPARLATIDPPMPPEGETAAYQGGYTTTSHNFEIVGDYLYSSWYRAGVKVHDISDPANPEELAHWENGDATSIWTAQAGVPGDFFVATSYQNPTDPAGPGWFYTFPDPTDNPATITPSGEDVTLPGMETATPTDTPEPQTPTDTPDPQTPTDAPTTPTDVSTATPTPTDTATDTPTTTGGSGPGFGPLAALAALGAGAWRLTDGDDDRE